MSKIREHIGNIELPAGKPGWSRYGWILVERDTKADREQQIAAYAARIEAALHAYQKLIRNILQEKPEAYRIAQPFSNESSRGVEYRADDIGYITLYDVDGNGKWDWVVIGEKKCDKFSCIKTSRSLEFITSISEGGKERPLLEEALDLSIRNLLESTSPHR